MTEYKRISECVVGDGFGIVPMYLTVCMIDK